MSGKSAAAWLAALIAFALVLNAPGIFKDGDTFWHIAAGRWMIDNQAVLRIDPFSYTFAGQPWQTHEWLSEILMALAYVGLGWNGISLLFACAFGLTAWLLSRQLARHLSGLALAVTILLSLCCTTAGLLARPHILALPLLVLWTAGLARAREENRAPSWKLLPAMVLWANLHGSFLFGLALVLPLMLEAVYDAKPRAPAWIAWGRFYLLAILAALITPFGVYTLTFPFTLMAMPELYSIVEWGPTKILPTSPLLLSTAAALYVLLSRGAKIRPMRLVLLLGTTFLALAQVRHQILLAVVAPILIAGPLATALNASPASGRTPRRLAAAILGCGILLFGIRLVWPMEIREVSVAPEAALAQVPAGIRKQPVFNDYGFGGYLIFQHIPVFIDGRAELYRSAFLRQYIGMTASGSTTLKAALDRFHVGWVILRPENHANQTIGRLSNWKRLYADRYAIVYVRKP